MNVTRASAIGQRDARTRRKIIDEVCAHFAVTNGLCGLSGLSQAFVVDVLKMLQARTEAGEDVVVVAPSMRQDPRALDRQVLMLTLTDIRERGPTLGMSPSVVRAIRAQLVPVSAETQAEIRRTTTGAALEEALSAEALEARFKFDDARGLVTIYRPGFTIGMNDQAHVILALDAAGDLQALELAERAALATALARSLTFVSRAALPVVLSDPRRPYLASFLEGALGWDVDGTTLGVETFSGPGAVRLTLLARGSDAAGLTAVDCAGIARAVIENGAYTTVAARALLMAGT